MTDTGTQSIQAVSLGPSQSREKVKQVTDNCEPNVVSSVVEDTQCSRAGREGSRLRLVGQRKHPGESSTFYFIG